MVLTSDLSSVSESEPVTLRMDAEHTSLLEKAENILGLHNVYDPFDFFPSETGFFSLSNVKC